MILAFIRTFSKIRIQLRHKAEVTNFTGYDIHSPVKNMDSWVGPPRTSKLRHILGQYFETSIPSDSDTGCLADSKVKNGGLSNTVRK